MVTGGNTGTGTGLVTVSYCIVFCSLPPPPLGTGGLPGLAGPGVVELGADDVLIKKTN